MRYSIGLSTLIPIISEKPLPDQPYFPARVEKIILSQDDPDWADNGGWDALGMIKFTPYYSNISSVPNIGAKPLYSNIKHYPLEQEIVYIMQLPDPTVDDPNWSSYYYIDAINLWNHPHHNALPKLNQSSSEESKVSYKEMETGLSKKSPSKITSPKFGNTFVEKSTIKPLLPFEGDIIYEGRWGQSIRMGSTVKDKNIWSTSGNDGDPITIIRNGQQTFKTTDGKKGWIPTTEDINKDESSIYFCSNQLIPINVASKNLRSFGTVLLNNNISVQTLADNPISSVPLEVTSSNNAVTSSTPVTSSNDSLPLPNRIFMENEVEFVFPGENTLGSFQTDGEVEEEDQSAESTQEKYNSTTIMNESSKTKTPTGEYILYSAGKVVGSSPVIFIGGIRVAKIYESKINMLLEAAKKDGIPIKLNSSLRTFDEQLALRKQNVKDKTKVNDEQYLLTATSTAFSPSTGKPGFSNHQNGKAFDFNTINPAVYKWLVKNGIKYSFVRTVGSERWHWEYRENTPQFAFVPKEHETWDKLV